MISIRTNARKIVRGRERRKSVCMLMYEFYKLKRNRENDERVLEKREMF